MPLGGFNSRGARGGAANRSQRGSGQGQTSRGALSSSRKSKELIPDTPSGPKAMQDAANVNKARSWRVEKPRNSKEDNKEKKKMTKKKNKGSRSKAAIPNSINNFEKERLENAAKREQRGGATTSGRGKRFEPKPSPLGRGQKSASTNPFALLDSTVSSESTNTRPFGAPMNSKSPASSFTSAKPNSFGSSPPTTSATTTTTNSFGGFGTASNTNGTASSSLSTTSDSMFGAPSNKPSSPPMPHPFSTKAAGTFGAPTVPSQSSFQSTPSFGTPSASVFGQPQAAISSTSSNPFGTPSPSIYGQSKPSKTFNGFSNAFGTPSISAFGQPQAGATSTGSSAAFGSNGEPAQKPRQAFGSTDPTFPPKSKHAPAVSQPKFRSNFASGLAKATPEQSAPFSKPTPNSLAWRIEEQLKRDRLVPPTLSGLVSNDQEATKMRATSLWSEYTKYREKVRTSLMKANLLDDPDKPKKLKDALEFKGTCEEMCPAFEIVTRIMDNRVDSAERDSPDLKVPDPTKMIKILARSAAGQDAPLPSDIRSAAALRRTIDYLFRIILGERELERVHNFLWDRTRAVRRDFVFHSSMNSVDLVDQIYCLEHITRFHAIALHQMSRDGIDTKNFSEQQEREQLSKALLSLMHTYEDCKTQGVKCENEIEFKAYYVLFNAERPDIMEIVQNWGWDIYAGSEEIQIALTLAETIQNNWDYHGPLNPVSTTEITQNAFAKFFAIVESRTVSYTMACFAEIYFNKIRKAILKTILSSYRKQRDQTKDWTITRLNSYLRFDDEDDVEPFVEAFGVRFDEADGNRFLVIDPNQLNDPVPPPKQPHSWHFVERKRGDYSLPETIGKTIYDESEELPIDEDQDSEDEGPFVKDPTPAALPPAPQPKPVSLPVEPKVTSEQSSILHANERTRNDNKVPHVITEDTPKPKSLFDRVTGPQQFSNNFFSDTPAQPAASAQPKLAVPPTQASYPTPSPPENSTAPTQVPVQASTPGPFSFTAPQRDVPKKQDNSSGVGAFKFLHPVTAAQNPLQSPATQPSIQGPIGATPPAFTFTPPTAATQTIKYEQPKSSLPSFAGFTTSSSQVENAPPTSQPSGFTSTNSSLTASQQVAPFNGTQSTPFISSAPATSLHQPSCASSTRPSSPKPGERLTKTTEWFVLGDDGLMDHFASYQAQNILMETFHQFTFEQQNQKREDEARLARAEANAFRSRSLATKYGQLWRHQAHRLWLKRKGRENRKARRELAESMRASKAARSANLVDDFRASTSGSRRQSLESLLNATGVLNGVHNSNQEAHAVAQDDHQPPKRQRSESSTGTRTSGASRHKRGKSENPLRRSLTSDPSYLSGDSRIHLLSNFSFEDSSRSQKSGVQTDYFRLKARGISRLSDGSLLASAAANDFLHSKRSFDGIAKVPSPARLPSTPKSNLPPVPKFWSEEREQRPSAQSTDIEALKARARTVMSEEKNIKKRKSVDDDEDLFERAKRIREQMDEGADWFRKEVARDTSSRSVS